MQDPSAPFEPRQVLLFSGHMVDAPGRPTPRFPNSKVPAAAAAIDKLLQQLDGGAGDLALTQGAAGGDLLFTQACLTRQVRVQWLQPLPEAEFIARSVNASDPPALWLSRYETAKATMQTRALALPAQFPALLSMPQALGPLPQGVDLWERANQWLLDTALAFGATKLRFICLWDGGGGDGPGGTQHMVQTVQRSGGQVFWVDTRKL
jgi:hypothetical protein